MSARRRHAATLLGLAILAALTLVDRSAGAGLAGLGVALVALTALALGRRDPWTVSCWVLAAALAAVPALRAATWVWLPCALGGVLLTSLAAAGGFSGRQLAVGSLALFRRLPLGAPFAVAPLAAAAHDERARLWPALRGGAIAALLLAVFVPLFTAADAAFAEIVDRAMPADLPLDRPAGRALVLVLVLAAGGALLLAAAGGPPRVGRPPKARLAGPEWLLPLGALVALFAAFVAIQLTTLFGGHDHVVRTTGLTYAEYARQGFGELIAAASLTLAVIAGARRWAHAPCARRRRLLRLLLAALCVLCLIVLASALERLSVYEEAFGFTRLRYAAHAQILWLAAVLVLALAAVVVGSAPWLPRAVAAVSAAGALAFALSNPDGRIAGHNVDRFERTGKLDMLYVDDLSADAAPALARLPADRAACATWYLRQDLAGGDAPVEANVGRSRARESLTGLPECEL